MQLRAQMEHPQNSCKEQRCLTMHKMIKASSLFYAIVISIIIAIVSSSFILFAYTSRIEFDNQELRQRLNLNAQSGLNLLMSTQSLVQPNQSVIIDLYGNKEDSVFLERKLWGAFEVIRSTAIFHQQKIERIAQIGFPRDSTDLYSIYLMDEGKPLALCGQTKITGPVYLPKSGIQRAYIEGQSYNDTRFIYGETKISKNELPPFNPDLLKHVKQLLKEKRATDSDSVLEMKRPFVGDSVYNSFKNNTLILKQYGPIRISNSVYSGNVIIVSDTLIIVKADAILKDVILVAPKIFFEKNFKGQLQAYASDSIVVKEEVSFAYPSVLGIATDISSSKCAILFSEKDTLIGNIFAHQVMTDAYKRTGIRLAEKSLVVGQLYSNGYVEVKGNIHGSVMCADFLLQTPSSVYENHLLNVGIDQGALPNYFTGINLVKEFPVKHIVKWLD